MARNVQVLLPLIYVVLVEAQFGVPFFDIPGLPHPPRPNPDFNNGDNTWFHHLEHPVTSDSNERNKPFVHFGDFYPGDPYYQGDFWDHMPGIHNDFNIPNGGFNSHRHQPPRRGNNPDENPRHRHDHDGGLNDQKLEEKPQDIKPAPDKDSKLNESNNPDMKNDSEILPPNTNEIKKDDSQKDKDNKQVDINKKKDFLLIGQGNNANNVYLLHENNPNPTAIITPNANRPGNNVIYIPYNPAQSNNPVYQVINGQPLPTNLQVSPDKIGVTGNNNAILNPGTSSMNLNSNTQSPGYVTIYSNGQLMQIPGVVVNSAPNNVPLQSGNAVQGTNYIIANAVPNNIQNVPAIQTPGTNVIYATLPNQASNGPIYVQIPNCISNGCGSGTVVQNPNPGVNNAANIMPNNGLPNNAVAYQQNPNMVIQPAVLSNGVSNGYVQPNIVANQGPGVAAESIPNQGAVLSNQNVPYQPAVELPIPSGSNGYNQPMVSNEGQGQNVPSQGAMLINQNVPIQPAIQMPLSNGVNGYTQPIISNQGQGPNVPNQGAIITNQNIPLQPAVEIPINTNGYNQPVVTNPSPIANVATRDEVPNSQNVPPQPTVSVNSQGDQGSNAIVNTPSQVTDQPENAQPLTSSTSSLVLDSSNLSSLGAQPAIMISGLKDTSGDKKDEKKSKDNKKDEKDKENKKDKADKKANDADKPKEPFTNKKI